MNKIDTIGKLADYNSKINKNKMEEEAHKKLEDNPPPPKPWYDNPKYGGASSREINKMNTKQKMRYIMEGRK